jgi:type I restriction enzyme S subunit
MELMQKQRYKQTEIGLIPEDWKEVSMREITTLMTNGFVGTATSHYSEEIDSVLYIQGYNVKENSFNFKGIKHVNQNFHKKNKKSSLLEGDLLTVQTGDVGLTTIVPKQLEGSNCHALIISRFNKKIAYPWFYSQYFNSKQGRSRLKELETGTTMKHINVGELVHWLVPLPSTLEEQKAIATALSDVDELISNLDKLINKKKAIKQGAMQQLLTPPHKGGKRLEGFSGEWIEITLGDIGQCIIGLTYTPSNVKDSGTLVLRSSNIQNGRFSSHDNVYVDSLIPEKLKVKKNDILICVRNGSRNLIGKCLKLSNEMVGQTWGAFMSVYRSDFNDYVEHLFKSNIIQSQIEENLGATINQITNKTLNSFKAIIPKEIDEQQAIAKIISDMDLEIEQLESKKAKHHNIKHGMMQELLTGKTRLI